MKKIIRILAITSLIITLCGAPVASAATVFPERPNGPLIITEILPGAQQSASQEFIEIYNQSAQLIDLSDQKWEVHLATSKATNWDKAKVAPLTGKIYPGGLYPIS